jgi:hypothetical protein
MGHDMLEPHICMAGLIVYFARLIIVNIVPKFHHALSFFNGNATKRESVNGPLHARFARPALPYRCSLSPARIRPDRRAPRLHRANLPRGPLMLHRKRML